MRRAVLAFVAFMMVVVGLSSVSYAAEKNDSVAVVVVSGDPEFKTKDTLKYIDKYFKTSDGQKVSSGKNVQAKYTQYWIDKGELAEGVPDQDTLKDFVSYSGYKKVLYMIISVGNVNVNNGGVNVPIPNSGGTSVFVPTQGVSASITVNTFLVEEDKIIKYGTNSEGPADKYILFKKSCRAISKEYNPYL